MHFYKSFLLQILLGIFMTYQNIIETFKLEVPTHVYIDAYGAEENIIKSITNLHLNIIHF